ncbi:TetR family transcriptional regulator [Haloactinospora alba]|uniref:TetR family transcriptional regulator n=1 Tax=Haloactinospora alba TaxID=405555 RepID=A0A543NEJ8_9ACTN|nr:TetR/AcrR family transcriptional regulator [Haloactinospora alba]TQN30246.1 TetR family transcriptional regulator [Haloactinospora alba]
MDNANPSPSDRREALKERHQRAIVDAAKALMAEISGTNFTVDQLAERADVSRRTVFNHFGTMDDVVLEAFSGMLGAVVDDIDANLSSQGVEQRGATSVFDQLTEAMRATDLVSPIVELTRIFDEIRDKGAPATPRQAVLFERAMRDLGNRISATVLRHHPSADPFEVEVMCAALVSGALVVHRRWDEATGGVDTPESRRMWDDLLDHLITATRNGFGTLTGGSGTS